MNRLAEYDINEVMGDCVLLEEYIEQMIGATRNGELLWERGIMNLLELESGKRKLLKVIGIYDRLVNEQKSGWPERKLERLYFTRVDSNLMLVVCKYCYDGRTPWDSETWVDVFGVKEKVVYRLIEHERCDEPEEYEFCAKVAEKLSHVIRMSYTGEGSDSVTVDFEGEKLQFN